MLYIPQTAPDPPPSLIASRNITGRTRESVAVDAITSVTGRNPWTPTETVHFWQSKAPGMFRDDA